MTIPPVPERPALFLDFDGTLVEIADRPDGVVVAPHLPDLLRRLAQRTDGALAVVSGRAVAQLDAFLPVPFAAAGLHGLERRPAPGAPVETPPPPPEIDTLRQRLHGSALLAAGVVLEDKGATLVVHYRAAPARGPEIYAALQDLVADLPALHLIHGKMVVEAKRAGADKGTAVRTFMAAAPFAGRTPIYLGDDVTDEDGIRAANEAGGFGIKVGEGDTAAPWRLPTVPAVHDWLARVAEARP